jgi:serine/threonine protein kinase
MSRTYYCATCLNSFQRDAPVCPNLGCGAERPGTGWGHLLAHGDLFDRHYLVSKRIAVAGAGICYEARESDASGDPIGESLAIKVLYTSRDSGPYLRRLASEAQILQDISHPNVLECRGFVNRMGHAPYLITRFERGGSLHDHVKHVGALPIPVAAAILRQVLSGLAQAHDRGIVHRDLKPQNVLLRAHVGRHEVPHALVADFGIAKVSGTLNEGLTQFGAFVGTPEFAAPEQFLGTAPTAATDVFAAGALLYYLITGGPPVRFTHRHDSSTCLEELLAALPPRLPEAVSTARDRIQVEDLLEAMMRQDMEARCTVPTLVDALTEIEALTSQAQAMDATLQPSFEGGLPTLVADLDLDDAESSSEIPERPLAPQSREVNHPPGRSATPPRPSQRLRLPQHLAQQRPTQPYRPAPSAPNLDDLFGGTSDVTAPRSDASLSPLSLDALFSSAPEVPPESTSAPSEPAEPTPTPSRAELRWTPSSPDVPPHPLPDDTPALLRLLGTSTAKHRHDLLVALDERSDLGSAFQTYAPGSDSPLGCGIGLIIRHQKRTTSAGLLRRLLQDRDPSVRACAAEAVPSTGSASILTNLSRLLRDDDPQVRISAALGLATTGVVLSRQDLVTRWLSVLEHDADPRVQTAWATVMAELR